MVLRLEPLCEAFYFSLLRTYVLMAGVLIYPRHGLGNFKRQLLLPGQVHFVNIDIANGLCITKDGTLIRGAIYLNETKPGFGYRKKISSLKNKKKVLKKLNNLKQKLEKEFGKIFTIDDFKFRILTDAKTIKKVSKKHSNCALLEEYPTHDAMEVELEFLS